MNTKKIALISILVAIGLIIFIVEAQVPLPLPLPGVKLGLANTVTLFALFYDKTSGGIKLGTKDAFVVLLCRILLGAVFTGRLIAFAYSLVGGLLALSAQVISKSFVTEKQVWVCSAIGAVFHNTGQIFAAVVITGTVGIIYYLPVLIIAGVLTGTLTGFVAQITLTRLSAK